MAAGALHSELDPAEARANARALEEGNLDLLYVSPERLLGGSLLERLTRQELALIAIDEAHCVSQWGHEFRREYRELSCLPAHFPGVPRVALTATADGRTRADILQALAMPDARMFAASFHRANLQIAAAPETGGDGAAAGVPRQPPGCRGHRLLRHPGKNRAHGAAAAGKGHRRHRLPCRPGAGGKARRAAPVPAGEAVVMVATIAFGMGIDRPDVRFVVHLDMPDSPEGYYQQIGRAGRDGERSETMLLYGGEDIARARHFLAQSTAPEAQKRTIRARLEAMIALTETASCRTRTLLACFGETLDEPCGHCDRCLAPPETFDGTTEAQKVLSAVYRTGQMFGALHIVAVLRGEATEPVQRHRHDKLPTFGVGADHPAPFWRGVIRQLIAQGALDVDTAGHGGLFMVAAAARPILRSETKVTLMTEGTTALRPPDRSRRMEKRIAQGLPAQDAGLFEQLRQWRSTTAKTQNVPPYVIFHDATLREIAAVRPRNMEEFAEIKGVGASKRDRYGRAVLEVLQVQQE